MRLPKHLICVVTDRQRLLPAAAGTASLDSLVTFVGAAARAGVDLIQLRERDLGARALATLTVRCMAEAEGTRARVLVNDRIDVAMAAGAHGVHLRGDSVDPGAARSLVPPEYIVGRSVHSPEEAAAAASGGHLNYLIVGTVFPSPSKPAGHAVAGLAAVARTAAAVSIPVLAVGGVTLANVEGALRAGAAGIAAIGLFIPPSGGGYDRHLEMCVASLRRVFDSYRAVP